MCEYIITEDFLMDKYIYDASNGLCVELQYKLDREEKKERKK